jgi:hypothetical protein
MSLSWVVVFFALVCCLALTPALASAREYRSSTVKHEFQRQHPWPSTGRLTGACPATSKTISGRSTVADPTRFPTCNGRRSDPLVEGVSFELSVPRRAGKLIPIDQAVYHPAVGSNERYAGDAAALGQQLLLSPEVGRYRVWRTRVLMIEISAARSRQLVLTRGKPRLSYTPLMKIVRC